MHSITQRGRVVIVYDSWEEVEQAVGHSRFPRYCEKCGAKLLYGSFYDSMERFTIKKKCTSCRSFAEAVATSEKKYEDHMLAHWADLVKKRAEYRCEMENSSCSGPLHAHHIIPKAADPSKKYKVENGICLCETHHKMIHSFM